MPNRIIKESICTSDTIDELSWFEEVLFYRLLTYVDDYGRGDGRVKVIKGKVFPLKDLSLEEVSEAMKKLSKVGLIQKYKVNEHPYIQMTTWKNHQNIRNKKSKFPPIEDGEIVNDCEQLKSIDINCNQLNANVPVIQSNPIQSESNPNPNPIRRTFKKPTLEELESYINDKSLNVNAHTFMDYYESNGWKVGRNPMKDWKATVRRWNEKEKPTKPKGEGLMNKPEFLKYLKEQGYDK